MGDGRYYTYYQFFDMLFLTLLGIAAVGSLVYGYYRKDQETKTGYVFLGLGIVILFNVLRVIEVVTPNLHQALRLRNMSMGLSIGMYILVLYKMEVAKYKKKIIFGVIAVCFGVFWGHPFIRTYEYHAMAYSLLYMALLCGIACLIMYKRRFGVLLVSICAYIFFVLNLPDYIAYYEVLLMLGFTIYLNRTFNKECDASLSILAFDKVRGMSTNYVFVIDTEGRLIYENKAAKRSGFFGGIHQIDLNHIPSVFQENSIREYDRFGETYLQLQSQGHDSYFAYKTVPLYQDEKLIGHIVTISNLTELIQLLIDLEDKKKQSKLANEKLKHYSKVVYSLEKDKEIQHLLQALVLSREDQMERLAELIQGAIEKVDDDSFERHVDHAIQTSNRILEDVRTTVSQYREYYRGDI